MFIAKGRESAVRASSPMPPKSGPEAQGRRALAGAAFPKGPRRVSSLSVRRGPMHGEGLSGSERRARGTPGGELRTRGETLTAAPSPPNRPAARVVGARRAAGAQC